MKTGMRLAPLNRKKINTITRNGITKLIFYYMMEYASGPLSYLDSSLFHKDLRDYCQP